MADEEVTMNMSTRSEEALVPSFVDESDDEEDEAKEEDYPFLFDVPSANNSPPLSPRQTINSDEHQSIAANPNILPTHEATANNILNNSDGNPSSNRDCDNNSVTNNAETTSDAQQQPTPAAPHTLNKRPRVKLHHHSPKPSSSWSAWLTSKEGQRSMLELVGVGIIVFVLFRVWWRQRSIAYDSLLLWLEKYTEVQRQAILLQMSREEVVTTLWKTSSDTLLTLKEHSHHLWQLQKQQPASLKPTVLTAAVTSAAASVASTLASSALSETLPVGGVDPQAVSSSSSKSTPVSSFPTQEKDDLSSTCSERLLETSTSSTPTIDPHPTLGVHQTEKTGGSQVAVRSIVSPVTWLVSMPGSVIHTLTHLVDYVLRQCIWESLFG